MEKADIKEQILIFGKARSNLLAVIIFTIINLFLTFFNTGVNFLFSATLPQVIFEIFKGANFEIESNILLIIGLILAIIIIIPYFIFWILAKRIRVFILVALIYFSIDSGILLFFIFSTEFDVLFLLDIAFHGWILYYLINGVKAWYKIRDVDSELYYTILQEIKPKGIKPMELPNDKNKWNIFRK